MKIGMPTLIELESLEENVQLCKALNLDFLEINMNFPQFQLDKLDANVLNKLKEEYGIFFTFHLAEDIDVGHMNKNIRNTYVGEALNILTFMKSIESKILNMHMSKGIYVTLPAEKVFIYEKYEEEFLSHIQTFSNLISEVIGDDDQTVFIENTGIGNIQYIRKAISQLLLNSNFKLTWDIGHDHASGLKDREFWEEHKTHIQHFHIHDAIKESNHLTLYDGEIDIDEYLKMAEQSNATVVLETKTIEALRESVKRLNQRTHYMDKH